MSVVAILFATGEGQTARIAAAIAEAVSSRGYEARLVDLHKSASPAILDRIIAVVLAAPVHIGRHDRAATAFVRRFRHRLSELPSAFVSVSLAAHGDPTEAERYVTEFLAETGWQPSAVAKAAGALPYTRYGFVERLLMRRIARAKPGGLGTDMSRNYEYTDWADVRRFAEDFLVAEVELGARRSER